MTPRRSMLLLAVGAAGIAACGIDLAGRLGAGTSDGSAPSADASVPKDGPGGDSDPVVFLDAANDSGDATNDGAVVVSPTCGVGQVSCGGSCVTASDCTGCSGGATYLCVPTRRCMASCATCTDLVSTPMPIECIACNSGQNNPIGSCGYNTAVGFCLSGSYSLAYPGSTGMHCDCSNTDVANCPGASQVCKPNGGTDWCITCGESGLATNGLPCKGGGNCNAGLDPPRCL